MKMNSSQSKILESDGLTPPSTSNFDKFRLLMWKNFLIQWRHKVQMVVEILVPVLLCGILVMIRSLVEPKEFSEQTLFVPFRIDTLDTLRGLVNIQQKPSIEEWKLVYSPRNDLLDTLIGQTCSELQLTGCFGVDNSTALETTMATRNLIAGIHFHNVGELGALPKDLTYELRFPSELRYWTGAIGPFYTWQTNMRYPLFEVIGAREAHANDGGNVGYNREGFLSIQNAIAKAYIRLQSNTDVPPIFMQRFPYPAFTLDIFIMGLKIILAFIIMLSFVYPTINTVRYIAIEKERQLKEAMKIMGLPNWLHWTGWFIKSMIFMTISISLITALFKIQWYEHSDLTVLTHTDWTALWFFLFCYSISSTAFCFMLSVFFSKANTAAAVAGLMWFVVYAPFSFTEPNYSELSLVTKLLLCLFNNTAMSYGFHIILRFESTGRGLQWSNLFHPVTIDDELSMGHIILMLLFCAVLYMTIALYVEKVYPGSFGVAEKWYFPFTKEFWWSVSYSDSIEDGQQSWTNGQDQRNYEPYPVGHHAGIQVKGLRKVYANKKVAVEGLTMNMLNDQITVLLGHNGAGKTTTMSMLTGMFPPTKGTAIINGCNIRTNIGGARESLGLCPQHNILFDELSVREHIVFYSRLKGMRNDEVAEEIRKYVKLLDLESKIDALSHTLSGGMKRKLSVGVAFCGGSKVVLCDEPSSGMDPAARRALWDVLQAEKKGRTILLSTHFMDEADILGDRIAIMADGQLKCYGSSFFLKKRFGTGYHLVCVKGGACNTDDVTELIRKYLPDLDAEGDIGTELTYQLPEDKVSIFPGLLANLEDNRNALGLVSFGVSLTTLEEVFMKVGTDDMPDDNVLIGNGRRSPRSAKSGYVSGTQTPGGAIDYEVPLVSGFNLIFNQFSAILKKKFIYSLRSWILLILQNIIPISFLVVGMLVVRSYRGQSALPPLEISLATYERSFTVLDRRANGTENSLSARITQEYGKIITSAPYHSKLIIIDEGFEKYILNQGKAMLATVDAFYLTAATLTAQLNGSEAILAWFNNQPLHTAPLTLNLVHNAVVRSILGSDHSIHIINNPLPFRPDSKRAMLDIEASSNIGFQLATNLTFAMSFVAAFYVLFYIRERACRAKLLQFVSGVNVFTFWITSYLWDFLTYMLTTVLLLITLVIFQEDGWSSAAELSRTGLVLVLFGLAVLPVMYTGSLLFRVPSTGFVYMTLFNICTGIALFIVIFMLSIYKLTHVSDVLNWIFMLFPHFSLSSSFRSLNMIESTKRACTSRCDSMIACTPEFLCASEPRCCEKDYFAWEEPGIGRNIVYFIATAVLSFIILMIIEYRLLNNLIYKLLGMCQRKPAAHSEDGFLDADVFTEKVRVDAMSSHEIAAHNLVLNNVTKYYRNILAVNQLSIVIRDSECFGLLGVNGAGKTSTFKMLTGDEKISYGEAWLRGVSLKNNMNAVNKMIGYCPQFDALLDDLTGRQTLSIFCLLRGVPRHHINTLSLRLANDLNFVKHLDKQVSEYSGGNKRKLSTAVALIGNPVVIYLDEPTTGMDPGAKRQLWNLICKVRNSGKSIVLTSHSMEECEALCTRLAIMVNGEFKCLGSTQYLKNKFSTGYVLSVKVRRYNGSQLNSSNMSAELMAEIVKIKAYISSNFYGAHLKEEHQGMLTYYVPPSNHIKWSKMFGFMETAKNTLDIEDYSISQTSLEQVFLSFTKYQRIEARDENK